MTKQFLNLHRAVAALLIACLPLAGFSAEAPRKFFDVPAGEAAAALKQLTTQSGVQLLYSTSELAGVKTHPVKGSLTVQEALDAMLADTGLVASQDAKTGAFAIRKGETGPNAERAIATASDRPASQVKVEDGMVKMGAFEVFGSKLINTDIPRTRDDPQPYVVFDRRQIEGSMATNLGDFFRARLPMNQDQPLAASYRTASSVNLRGLGPAQTLILVDGRRMPAPASNSMQLSQPDLNGIPLSMIERIEILPSTASGIYGGGATGGVVNIITRKDYSGVDVVATYINTFDTDSGDLKLEINGSLSLRQGRTVLTFNASRSGANELLVQDRDLLARGRARQFANNPGAFLNAFMPPAGYTTNIRNQSGANLVLKPQFGGATLPSPITFVPVGYAGPSTDNGAALVTNAGKYNLGLPDTGLGGGRSSLRSVAEQESYTVGARHQFSPSLEAYVDASRLINRGSVSQGFGGSTGTVAASAPSNPFTTAVNVNFPLVGIIPTAWNDSTVDRITTGVVAKLPHEWSTGLDYTWSKSTNRYAIPLGLIGDPDGSGPGLSFAAALSNGTLDPFKDPNAFRPDFAPYLVPLETASEAAEYALESNEVVARAAGPIYHLPAGPVGLSASVQWRTEKIADAVATQGTSSPPTIYRYWPAASQEARAAYLELRMPIFGERDGTLLRNLELQASLRHDISSVRARSENTTLTIPGPSGPFPAVSYFEREWSATKSMLGVRYAPTKDLTLRASWGTGFLAPSLFQISPGNTFNLNVSLIDPKRGGVLQTVSYISPQGGNPDLRPEQSESFSAGVIITPRFLKGLRLSVDLTRIEKTDEISFVSNQQLLVLEDRLPGRIIRAPLTAQDQALGYTGGVVTHIVQQSINLARKQLTAWDIQADYDFEVGGWGKMRAYVSATYQPEFKEQVVPSNPFVNRAGTSSVLKWRGNGGLDWSRGPWGISWNMQYYDTYTVFSPTFPASLIASQVLNQGNGGVVPSQTYHDVSVRYRFGDAGSGWRKLLANSQLTVGVQNVLNTRPPVLSTTSSSSGGFSFFGDPRLSRYVLSVRKHF